jgi:pimeloyl-ACP methyl ester carboxylesterase
MKPILPTLLALSVLIASCSHPKINMHQADTSKLVIKNTGLAIAYTDTGYFSDTALLFVHGWGINRQYWSSQVAHFARQYRVVTMDLVGFGQSGKNRSVWTTTAFANDVDSVIARLKLKKVILIGHSMSGDIVLQAAVDNPSKIIGLVGVDNFKGPGIPDTEAGKKGFADAMAQMKLRFVKVASDYTNQALFTKTTPPAVRKRVLYDITHTDSTVAIAAMEGTEGYDEIGKLKQANKKLYLISSDVTPTDTTYLVKNKLPFHIFYVPGSGHYPMNEHPEVFHMLLENVIKSLAL